MFISCLKYGKETTFLNSYSNYSSVINGFKKDCTKIAEQKGMKTIDVAGELVFVVNISFECSYEGKKKKCNSIREVEKWLENQEDLKKTKVIIGCNELEDMELKVLDITRPVFFGHAHTSSQFLYDLFKKKTKNWLVELTE